MKIGILAEGSMKWQRFIKHWGLSIGIVIVTGCAHQGIIRIIEKTITKFNDKIYLLIGGIHLKDLASKEVDEIVLKLKNYGIENIAPMHCTGRYATYAMKKAFGDKFMPIKQGMIINLA